MVWRCGCRLQCDGCVGGDVVMVTRLDSSAQTTDAAAVCPRSTFVASSSSCIIACTPCRLHTTRRCYHCVDLVACGGSGCVVRLCAARSSGEDVHRRRVLPRLPTSRAARRRRSAVEGGHTRTRRSVPLTHALLTSPPRPPSQSHHSRLPSSPPSIPLPLLLRLLPVPQTSTSHWRASSRATRRTTSTVSRHVPRASDPLAAVTTTLTVGLHPCLLHCPLLPARSRFVRGCGDGQCGGGVARPAAGAAAERGRCAGPLPPSARLSR